MTARRKVSRLTSRRPLNMSWFMKGLSIGKLLGFVMPGSVMLGSVIAGSVMAGSVMVLLGETAALAQSAPIAPPSSTPRSATRTAYSAYSTGVQSQTDSRIVLSLEKRRVYLYKNDMLVSSYPVAIGTAETPTPTGEFTISKMVIDPIWQSPWTGEITPPGPDSALGLRWLEFATSEEGAFGFHGTPAVESIGQAASNGCVRLRNEDVVALFSQVSIGTPVIVQ